MTMRWAFETIDDEASEVATFLDSIGETHRAAAVRRTVRRLKHTRSAAKSAQVEALRSRARARWGLPA